MAATRTTSGEVLGVTVKVSIDGVMSVFQSRMREMLDEHGIEKPDPKPDEWYPLEDFLQVLDAVESDVGENALNKVGESTPRFAEWPADPDGPQDALEHLIDIFETNHRNVPGSYEFERTGDGEGQITSTTPYPTAWESGLIKGAAELHGSKYTRVNVVEESTDETVFEVDW